MPALKNLKDQKFGRWFVIGRSSEIGNSGQVLWSCKCECGTVRDVQSDSLINGRSQSCGCLNQELRTTHGMSNSPEYVAWANIKTRCYNPSSENYQYYGGRGIQMCDRWLNSFENFYADMGTRPSNLHSIERDNTNGDYEPNNCKWATWGEQANNRRNNVLVNFEDKNLTRAQAANSLGMSKETFHSRVAKGMSVEEIAAAPVNSYQHRTFTFNGETGNLAFWSSKTGISADTLRYRLVVAQWPVEKALST